jgi:hypothetical protein
MSPQFYLTYLWLSVALSILAVIYVIHKYVVAVRNRPRFQQSDVLFEERFASGFSLKNIFTQLGGAHNCLRLVITKDWLWVTSWLPFSLITPLCDLEHVIPRNGISAFEAEANSRVIRLTYTDQDGSMHSLKLIPKDSNSFIRALGDSPRPSTKPNKSLDRSHGKRVSHQA